MTSVRSNFQKESSQEGKNFEQRVYCELLKQGYEPLIPNKLPEGPNPDFFYIDKDGVEVYVECKGGQKPKTAGARRVDNVQKAIGEGIVVKHNYPNCRFNIWFSAEPTPGSTSDNYLKSSKGVAYDEVFYLPYKNTS